MATSISSSGRVITDVHILKSNYKTCYIFSRTKMRRIKKKGYKKWSQPAMLHVILTVTKRTKNES